MKSDIRPATRIIGYREWRPWFAWYPVRACTAEATDNYRNPWRWVWWEPVEYRGSSYVDIYYTLYRIPGTNVK